VEEATIAVAVSTGGDIDGKEALGACVDDIRGESGGVVVSAGKSAPALPAAVS
jgi:hypothetical protein